MSDASIGIQILWALCVSALVMFAIHQGRKRKRKQDAEKLQGGKLYKVGFRAKSITALERLNGSEIEFKRPKHSQSKTFNFNTEEFQLYYALSGNIIHLSEEQLTMDQAREAIGATAEQIVGIGRLYVNTQQMIVMNTPLEISDEDYAFFIDWDLQVDS